jgi:Cu/Ag efflux pump CusA
MMRWLIESSIRLRFLVITVAVILLAFGLVQLRDMPVDVYPEFDPPMVEVQTEALGLSATEVESLITVPMEADLLNGVAWLDQLYSQSVAGLSSILLVFEPGTDAIAARQMVQERLTQAFALPNVSKPPVMIQPLSSTSRVMIIGLSSDTLTPIEMGVLARWTIQPRLMGVPGVANVAVWGQRDRQLQVQVDPAKLHDKGVTLDQVIATAGKALWVSPLSFLESSTPGTAGFLDTPNQRLGLHHVLPIASPEDLAKVPVEDNSELLLGDVANIVEDHQPLIGDAALKDGAGLLLVVEKFPNANTLELTRGVEEALAAMRPGLAGITIDTNVFRPANYIELALGNLSTVAMLGALLLLAVLVAFFFNWRTALIGFVAIVMSLTAALLVLYQRGATLNMMILAGLVIALAAVIDDAIIDVENAMRHLRQARPSEDAKTPAAVVTDALLEMRSSVMYAILIILLALLPTLFLPHLAGAFFQPVMVSLVLALVASLVVALIVTPALCVALLGATKPGRPEPPLARGLQRVYGALLGPSLRASFVAVVVAVLVVLVGIAAVPMLNWSPLPALKQTDLLVQWQGAPGTSLPAMNRITAQVTEELRAIPGVRNVGSHVGRAVTGDQVVGSNAGMLWINLDPAAPYAATVAAVNEVIDGYPGLLRTVQTYQPDHIGDALAAANNEIVVRMYGHDLDMLHAKAQEVSQALTEINGITAAQATSLDEEPQVEIEVDLASAAEYGMKPGDIRRQATTLLSGLQVGSLYEDQKVFDVTVWGTPEVRANLTSIGNLLITTPSGEQVPLHEVAAVRIAPAPTSIERDAVSRFVDVKAVIEGRDLAAVTADIRGHLQVVEFPPEFHAEVLGETAERQSAQQLMLAAALIAVLGMFLLLQASFNSWRMALIAWLTLPMVVAGGILAVLIDGGSVSLGSIFGLFAAFAVGVRNVAVLTNQLQRLRPAEGAPFDNELILHVAQARVVPVVMTALATALAVLPLLTAGDVAGVELLRPMAIALSGGLLGALLLNLYILPALYLRYGAGRTSAQSSASLESASAAGD